jgi:hypothetical protein
MVTIIINAATTMIITLFYSASSLVFMYSERREALTCCAT